MSHKFTILAIASALMSQLSIAQNPGDTLTISSHQNTHMDWFKNYNEETTFPTTGSFKKIIMEYTLGCPGGGCSDWDYTTQINVLNPTGVIDSTLKQAPSFIVDGSQMDTLAYSSTQTFTTSFNTTTNMTDTIASDSIEVILFGDTNNPTTATDTFYVFDANYENYEFDASGNSTDTTFISATDTIYKSLTPYYESFEVIDKIELGRAITPYAAGFSTEWTRTFSFEVTEFSNILQAQKTIQAHYSGWSDGFTATIDFHFIHGTPPRDIVGVYPLWHASPKYGEHIDGIHTIENSISEQEYDRTGSDFAELTFTPTGHGFGGAGNPENCAEFCAKTFDVISNGTNIGQETIWKDDCGENALFPQPGTWLYDRANWCPGEQVRKFNFDLTPSSNANTNTIDVNFQNYTSGNQGSYTIDAYVTTYGEFNFTNNVEIVDILAPTNKYDYSRFNPICGQPIFTFKNLAGQNATSVTFKYGVEGVSEATFNWTGDLAPLSTEEITLPALALSDFTQTNNTTFYIRAENVNSTTDEDMTDNEMKSNFEPTEILPRDFKVQLKTNSFGNETAWSISKLDGTVMYSQNSPSSNATHDTEIHLDPGCYKFELTDAGKDGLSFWANPGAGNGSIRFRKLAGGFLKAFGADFGSKIVFYFTAQNPLGENELLNEKDITILPNPNNGKFSLTIPENHNMNTVSVIDVRGREIYTETISKNNIDIQLNTIKNGVYFVKLEGKDNTITKKMVISN